jgi:DNA-binding NarL/FixJ family response regulator
MVSALLAEHIPVVGEGPALEPAPDLTMTTVLIFEADGLGFSQAMSLTRGWPVRLVATLRAPTGSRLRELADAKVCAILLLDDLTPENLVRTTRLVAQGNTTLSHSLLMRLMDYAARISADATGALTARERQVLQMLADGQDTRSIATKLNYSERTVKNIVHDLLVKLNCRTRAQAVGMAAKAGVI